MGRATEWLEHGSECFDHIRIAARKNGERPVSRTDFAAGHGCIDVMRAGFAQALSLATAGLDRDGTHDKKRCA
ncbi:MAG: hypothetical protein NVSMB26_01640 [Beijerinckiaceae bacterium]